MRIPDASSTSVEAMVKFMYTGCVPANISDMVADLLHLADKYGLECLKKACEKTLADDLTVENAINTIILTDRWGIRNIAMAPGLKKPLLIYSIL